MREERTIAVADIRPHPKQYRKLDPAHVAELAASIEASGLFEPLEVMQDGDVYYVESGHHRLAALQKLGTEYVSVYVTNDEDATSAVKMVAVNISRPDDPTEKARGLQLMLATGVAPSVAARHVGISEAEARGLKVNLKTIAEAPETLTLDWALAINEFSDDPEDVKKLLKAKEHTWRTAADKIRNRREQDATIIAVKRVLVAADVRVLPDDEDPDELVYTGYTTVFPGHEAKLETPEDVEVSAAQVTRCSWGNGANVSWYASSESVDAARVKDAKQREAAEKRVAVYKAILKRLEDVAQTRELFVIEHADDPELLTYAAGSWASEHGYRYDPRAQDVPEAFKNEPLHERLVIALLMRICEDAAMRMSSDWDSPWTVAGHRRACGFLTLLESIGYQLDDAERAYMKQTAKAAEKIAKQKAKEADDE